MAILIFLRQAGKPLHVLKNVSINFIIMLATSPITADSADAPPAAVRVLFFSPGEKGVKFGERQGGAAE